MQRLKYYGLALLLALVSLPSWSDSTVQPVLNEITLQLNAEQWLTTTTALVTVNVNASVTDQGIEKLQTDVMQKLKQLANADWHIVSFDRQQDQSGLESVQILAQARLVQGALGPIRGMAKSLSKPGETLTINNVEFTPSDEEVRQASNQLRINLYQQAKAELAALNNFYPEQHYYLHKIDFNTMSPVQPMPMMVNMMAKTNRAVPSAPLMVGNKLTLQANVVLASTVPWPSMTGEMPNSHANTFNSNKL